MSTMKHDDDEEEKEGEDNPSPTSKTAESGYFRTFWKGVFAVVIGVFALLAAAVMCAVCVFFSCLLWLRGLWSVIEWVLWKLSDEGRDGSGETANLGYPTAMPGQEHGNSWRHAWDHVAKAQNFRVRHEHESEHFHVAPLLQSTTGLDMERLCFLTMKKKRGGNSPTRKKVSPGDKDEPGENETGDTDEPDPEAAGGYMFPVQHSSLPVCPPPLDADFETKVKSFLEEVRESPGGDVLIPPFTNQRRTDRDGTAVIPAVGGGELSQGSAAEAGQGSRASSQPIRTTEPVLGLSIWETKLEEGETYSDEHGVRLSVPARSRREGQQLSAGPVLLELTADVVKCGEEVFFVTTIVHCFRSGIGFVEPPLLDFAVEPKDESTDTQDSYKVLVRKDESHPWSVSETAKYFLDAGKGVVQARIENFTQFALGDVSNKLGYHVLRRPRFDHRRGLLRTPSGGILDVTSDQFGLWNRSGHPLQVFVLTNTLARSMITSGTTPRRAPAFGGGSGPTEPTELEFEKAFDLVRKAAPGTVLASILRDRQAEVYTAWPGSDGGATILIATFENGKAHLWATPPSARRGTCLVFTPGCIEGKSPMLSRSCAEGDVQSTVSALHVAGSTRSSRLNAPVNRGAGISGI